MSNPSAFVPSDLAMEHPADRLPPGARRLATLAGFTLGALLPILMTVANKSAPAMLGVTAISANLAAYWAGYGPLLRDRYTRLLLHRTSGIALALMAICLCSLTWSISPAMTMRGLVEGLPELVFALMVAAAWPLVARPRDVTWLLLGIFGAAALIGLEYGFGMPIHRLIRARGEAWDLKRSAIPPLLLLWPAVGYCLARRHLRLAVSLGAAALFGIVVAHSGSPGFAMIAALGFGALAFALPRLATVAASFLLAFLIVAAPWTGTLARVLPAGIEATLAEEHAAHRIRIWSAFEDRVRDQWVMGHGFNASYRVSEAPRPDGLPVGLDNAQMSNNHPHNVFLQIWVELGGLGAVAAAGAFGAVFMRLKRLDGRHLAPRLALLITVVGVGLVGLSAWQPWWLATIVASLLWFDMLSARFDV